MTAQEIPTTAAELREHVVKMQRQYGLPQDHAEDQEMVIDAAESAVKGWKRLGEFIDPIYVRNIHGALWVIEDIRAYDDDPDGGMAWTCGPLAGWVDSGYAASKDFYARLADAKQAAAELSA